VLVRAGSIDRRRRCRSVPAYRPARPPASRHQRRESWVLPLNRGNTLTGSQASQLSLTSEGPKTVRRPHVSPGSEGCAHCAARGLDRVIDRCLTQGVTLLRRGCGGSMHIGVDRMWMVRTWRDRHELAPGWPPEPGKTHVDWVLQRWGAGHVRGCGAGLDTET
jgi:hypothetical protein